MCPCQETIWTYWWRFLPIRTPLCCFEENRGGKEALARRIHQEGPRRDFPFIRVSGVHPGREDLERWLWGEPLPETSRLTPYEGGTLYIHQIGAFPKGV